MAKKKGSATRKASPKASKLSRDLEKQIAAIPKGVYCDRIGIHYKVAIEQSKRFSLPYHSSGKTVDLFAVLAAWHQWASSHKQAINRVLQAEQLEEILDEDGGTDSLDFWQRELVKEKAIRERDARLQREGSMLPREVFHDFLQEFYVEPMRRRIDSLDKRDDPVCSELADSLRDDIHTFEEGIEIVFREDEKHLPKSKTPDTAT